MLLCMFRNVYNCFDGFQQTNSTSMNFPLLNRSEWTFSPHETKLVCRLGCTLPVCVSTTWTETVAFTCGKWIHWMSRNTALEMKAIRCAYGVQSYRNVKKRANQHRRWSRRRRLYQIASIPNCVWYVHAAKNHYKHIKSRFCGKCYFDLSIGRLRLRSKSPHIRQQAHLFRYISTLFRCCLTMRIRVRVRSY